MYLRIHLSTLSFITYPELQCKPVTQGESLEREGISAVTMVRPYKPEPSRNWTPIDNFNKDYMDSIKKGHERKDFIEANIVRELFCFNPSFHLQIFIFFKCCASVDFFSTDIKNVGVYLPFLVDPKSIGQKHTKILT